MVALRRYEVDRKIASETDLKRALFAVFSIIANKLLEIRSVVPSAWPQSTEVTFAWGSSLWLWFCDPM